MLARQMAAPNSPQWFNTGLHWAYGIDGPAQGHYYADEATGEVAPSASAYERPQPHACFIQSVADDLVNEGGIMDLWVREARLFKYGSGTGSNFSDIRGENEPLSGGGRSSGLMSFLKIGDRAAGAIKSGGTTRRAAKMVVVDADHPDIEAFIDWKTVEEQKVAALVAGSKLAKRRLEGILRACREGGRECFDPADNPALRKAIRAARRDAIPEGFIQRALQFARQGHTGIAFRTYDTDWDSAAYRTVSGQNANNTVRVDDDFMRAVHEDEAWALKRRTDGATAKTVPARELWDRMAAAAWQSADPGIQFDTTINDWHTCPESGAHPRVQPVLGIHVPRRYGVQPRLAQPARLPPRGRWFRHRRLSPRGAPVDGGARNLGRHGAVPVARDRPPFVALPHAWPGLRESRRPVDDVGPRL